MFSALNVITTGVLDAVAAVLVWRCHWWSWSSVTLTGACLPGCWAVVDGG